MDGHYSLVLQFDDFEEFTEAFYGYNLEAKQLDRGFFSATSQQILSDSVVISHLETTRRLEIRGNPPPTFRSFGIPTEACQPLIWRNQYSDGNTIQLYRDTTEVAMVTQPFFEAIDLSVTEETLNQQCQILGLPALDDILGDTEMLACHPNNMEPLRNALRRVSLILSNDPSQINTIAMQQEIKLEIPRLLLNALSSAEPRQRYASPGKRRRALKKAVDYIREFSNTPIALNDLCQEAQVSARTLQYTFISHFGLTPKAYLRTQRLNDAHKELFASSPADTRVTDIALLCGFDHMGQFATDYRKLFGELPSATLTRSKCYT